MDHAVLTVPYAGTVEDRTLERRVCPVVATWEGWSTRYDEELYARGEMDLRRGSGALSFDLTTALRAVCEHGLPAEGFVLTVGGIGEGVRAPDLARLSDLHAARLTVKTTALPSGRPPAWLARRGRG